MAEDEYIDYALVRDALIETQKRRGFLTYEQKMALQHAEWSARIYVMDIKQNLMFFKKCIVCF